ncbi:MAG: hypothetical protein HY521_01065 [Proteobacteria bacterium]|nr:hypothetical protein [Pseudomonadota bacterium]
MDPMKAQMELATKRLFSTEGLAVNNVKLFPGSNRDTTPEQMAEQINKAISQIDSGDFDLVDQFDD